MDKNWYYLDPDHRVEPPKKGMYCARCMKPLKLEGSKSFKSIKVHPIHPWFRIAGMGEGDDLIGEHCFNLVQKLYPEPCI